MVLISEDYRALQTHLHQERDDYGSASLSHVEAVRDLAAALVTRDVLDYGCGKGRLGQALQKHQVPVRNYDPGVPAWSADPAPADLVVCIDVLEHIEPACIEDVLADLRQLTRKLAYLSIDLAPASKMLADGRNAHLIIEPLEWWLPRLWSRFTLLRLVHLPGDKVVALVANPAWFKEESGQGRDNIERSLRGKPARRGTFGGRVVGLLKWLVTIST